MALKLTDAAWQTIRAHAREGYPHEVVGILAGERATGVVHLAKALVNERADAAHHRYAVSALVLYRAEEALQAEGHEIVGYYHTHPDHPSRWSDYDRDHALPHMSYLILSVRGGAPASAQSWRLRDDRSVMDEEPVFFPEETMIRIQIPTALRAYTEGNAEVQVAGDTAGQALDALTTTFPGLQRHLRTEQGALRSFVNVYLNDEDIRFLQRESTSLRAGDTLVIVPSIAGGRA